jgi:molybdate transport system substrate-binding protein
VRRFNRIVILVICSTFSLVCTGAVSAASEITVSVALSLKTPFEEIGRSCEKKHPGTKVNFNAAASGVLQKQIEAGAQADVFASASPKEMDALEAGGLLIRGTRADFASNSVVMIAPVKSQLQIRSFNDLRKKEVKRVAIGNPATVPAGKYAEGVLRHFGVWDAIKDKLVFAENVRQVMDYTARGEVDAGMIFLTDVGNSRDVRLAAEAPSASHQPVIYVIAGIRGSRNEKLLREFIAMVISEEGRKTMHKYGFSTVR